MISRFACGIAIATSVLAMGTASAAELPEIKLSERNAVPACVTPGRLMAFLRARNDKIDPRFEKISVEYMRKGEELGVRWDYAFFQMAIETSYLSFKRDGGRRGDVKPTQFNLAGLGATGNGEPGESFPDLQTGVTAHLQHVLVYAGEDVESPVADRTRKVIQWGVLKSFHKKIKGPVTYSHLAQKWATSGDYAEAIETHASKFFNETCKQSDPNPELLAEARGEKVKPVAVAAKVEAKPERVSGAELARRAIEDGKADENNSRLGLGAAGLVKALTGAASQVATGEKETKAAQQPVVPAVVNAPAVDVKPETPPAIVDKGAEKPADKSSKPATFMTASAAGSLPKQIEPPTAGAKCKVWTASYGGQKAMIIKVDRDKAVNYTVLDVNEGNEKREADAYIEAYAKGGVVAGEFSNQTQALDKAFELCPEG